MPERTDIVVSATTEGFQQAQQDAQRLTEAAARATQEQAKGYQAAQEQAKQTSAAVKQAIAEQREGLAAATQSGEKYAAEVGKLQERLKDLKEEQQAAIKAMLGADRAGPVYQSLKRRLGEVSGEIKLTTSALDMMAKSATGDRGVTQAADRLVTGFAKAKVSQRQYRREAETLKRELAALSKEQFAVAQAMGVTGRGTQTYAALQQRMGDVRGRTQEASQRLQTIEQARGRGGVLRQGDMAQGAFTQGLMQALFPQLGTIQRGPGMGRQLAGAMTGRAARGVASGLFGGVQGMQEMLGSMPVPGAGVLAAQFGQGMSFAGGGLQQMGTRLRAAPLLGGMPEISQRFAEARAQAGARARATFAPQALTPQQIEEQATAAGQRRMEQMRTGQAALPEGAQQRADQFAEELMQARIKARAQELAGGGDVTRAAEMIAESEMKNDPQRRARLREFARQEVVGGEIAEAGAQAEQQMRETLQAPERRRRRAMRAAEERQRASFFMPVRQAGQEFAALGEQESLQMIQQITGAGGGGLQDLRQQGMLGAGFAAQTALGIGPGVAGQFLMGGRRGGMVGARGRGGEVFAESIGDAMSLGLDGSELNTYMQQVASGIETWKQTGMPINTQSIGKMGRAFTGTGIEGVRGGVMAQQLNQGLQRISQQGIQGGVDLLAAQTFGGFEGGGLQGFWETQKRLEAGGGEGGITEDMLKQFVQTTTAAGGGGAGGLFTLREAMSQLGVQMGAAETEQFQRGIMNPEEMTEEQRARMTEMRQQMAEGMQAAPKGVAGLEEQARDMIGAFGKEIQRASRLQNKQNDIGEQLVPTFHNLQKSSLNINKIFTDLADGPLLKFSEISLDVTKNLSKLATQLDKVGSSGALQALGQFVTY